MATPNAVVSITSGRRIIFCEKLACICMRSSFAAAPPSTRISFNCEKSFLKLETESLTDNAIPSRQARAICDVCVPRVSPNIAALASEFQYGVPMPVKKGMNKTSSI